MRTLRDRLLWLVATKSGDNQRELSRMAGPVTLCRQDRKKILQRAAIARLYALSPQGNCERVAAGDEAGHHLGEGQAGRLCDSPDLVARLSREPQFERDGTALRLRDVRPGGFLFLAHARPFFITPPPRFLPRGI